MWKGGGKVCGLATRCSLRLPAALRALPFRPDLRTIHWPSLHSRRFTVATQPEPSATPPVDSEATQDASPPPNKPAVPLATYKPKLEAIGQAIGIKELSDWYGVSQRKVKAQRGGFSVLRRFGGSLEAALLQLYPEYPWESARFQNRRHGFWGDIENHKAFLHQLEKDFAIKQPTDWYRISRRRVLSMKGGAALLQLYPTLEAALKVVYPEYPWESSRFASARSGFWKEKRNMLKALSMAETEIGIQKPEDWYSVRLTDLRDIGFPYSLSKIKLAELLAEKYPDHKWDRVYLLRGKFAQQKRLERSIELLFPNEEIKTNVKKESGLINPQTGEYLELDIFVPKLNLAFEYQERHHYTSTDYAFDSLESVQKRDAVKKKLAEASNITLVIVPCWWDGTTESLAATIKAVRPDLLTDTPIKEGQQPIPPHAPPDFFTRQIVNIPDIGQPTTACFFTHSRINPVNWWLFEKYDGIRGLWNPHTKAFYSRFGNKYSLPQEIIDSMPADIFLDGELWFGEDSFQDAMKIANRADPSRVDWKKFKYMVFDIPNDKRPYGERYKALEDWIKSHECKYVTLAPKELCKDQQHLERFFQEVIDKGGEGVILRDPKTPYQPGRSLGYLKHKKFRDAEAKIIGATGKYRWECELPNGVRFTAPAGTVEFSKKWQPKPGDIVSFKHHGFLFGTKRPNLPTLYRVRPDLAWQDVVKNWKEQKTSINTVSPLWRKNKTKRPNGYWMNVDNRRRFFMQFAKDMGFDPLVADNWTKVTSKQIHSKKGSGLLNFFGGSLRRALEQTFPEFEPRPKPKGQQNTRRLRLFFESLAKENALDPAKPEEWTRLTNAQVLARRGGRAILNQYGSIQRALAVASATNQEQDIPISVS